MNPKIDVECIIDIYNACNKQTFNKKNENQNQNYQKNKIKM